MNDLDPSRVRALLAGASPWLASDVLRELDDELRLPILDRERLQREAVRLTERRFDGPTTTDPTSGGTDAVADFVRALELGGEDVGRLARWVLALGHWSDVGLGADAWSSDWRRAFVNWTRGRLLHPPKYVDPDAFSRLVDSYEAEARRPAKRLRSRIRPLEERWRAGPEGRTERDERLCRLWFDRADTTPLSPIGHGYSRALDLRWWRAHREDLDEDGHAGLLAEMVLDVYRSGWADVVRWADLVTLDRAFDPEGVPDLRDVRAGDAG